MSTPSARITMPPPRVQSTPVPSMMVPADAAPHHSARAGNSQNANLDCFIEKGAVRLIASKYQFRERAQSNHSHAGKGRVMAEKASLLSKLNSTTRGRQRSLENLRGNGRRR